MAPKIVESINGRAIFVIVVIERWTSFYRIYDRQITLADFDPGFNYRKVDQSFEKGINDFLANLHCHFSHHERF